MSCIDHVLKAMDQMFFKSAEQQTVNHLEGELHANIKRPRTMPTTEEIV